MRGEEPAGQPSPGSLSGPDARARAKGYRGVAMEGPIARWYARTRGSAPQIAAWKRQAGELAKGLPSRAEVLEVAPGPGYFSVELARLGSVRVSALEISHTFVQIARDNARRAGVRLTVEQGDAAAMPFADGAFDLVVCQAAFKNFSRPQAAVNEMYRVLKSSGAALIEDMRHDASNDAIREEVRAMRIGPVRSFFTRQALRGLRRRAYTAAQFEEFARRSPFEGCGIVPTALALEVRLSKG